MQGEQGERKSTIAQNSLIGRSSFYNLARRSLRRWCRQMKRNRCSSHQPFGLQHLDEDATRRAREAAIARFRAGELGRGHTRQLRPQRPWQWLGQNQDLAQLIVIQRKRDHRSAKLRAPFSLGYWERTDVKAAEVLGLYKIQNASRDFFANLCRLPLRGLRSSSSRLAKFAAASRLVARQPIWSPSGATQRYVRNRGRGGSARLALETTLMTPNRPSSMGSYLGPSLASCFLISGLSYKTTFNSELRISSFPLYSM